MGKRSRARALSVIFTCMLSSMLSGRRGKETALPRLGIGKLLVKRDGGRGRGRKRKRRVKRCLHAVPGGEVFVYHLPARQVAHSTGNLDGHVDQVLLGDGLQGNQTDRRPGILTKGRKEVNK